VRRSGAQGGFTLLELVVALTLMALLSLALYGVISVGARAAGSGERRTEQARRFRIATDVLVRQIRSAAPELAVIEGERDQEALPYFLGESDHIDFITSKPQGPNNTGLALVSYWQEDGMLMMSETPYFLAFAEDRDGREFDDLVLTTPLLSDVANLRFSYQRFDGGDEGSWEDSWDASFEDALPAGVRIELEQSFDGGFRWYHEVPVFVGVMNEITGEEDFRSTGGPSARAPNRDDADEPDDDTNGSDDDADDDDDFDDDGDDE